MKENEGKRHVHDAAVDHWYIYSREISLKTHLLCVYVCFFHSIFAFMLFLKYLLDFFLPRHKNTDRFIWYAFVIELIKININWYYFLYYSSLSSSSDRTSDNADTNSYVRRHGRSLIIYGCICMRACELGSFVYTYLISWSFGGAHKRAAFIGLMGTTGPRLDWLASPSLICSSADVASCEAPSGRCAQKTARIRCT